MDTINIYIKAEKVIDETKGAGIMVFEDSRKEAHFKTINLAIPETPHRAKLKIMLELLKALKYPCNVGIYLNDIGIKTAVESQWYLKWRDNGYKTAKGKDVKDRDLWEELSAYLDIHHVGIVDYISTFDSKLNQLIKEA